MFGYELFERVLGFVLYFDVGIMAHVFGFLFSLFLLGLVFMDDYVFCRFYCFKLVFFFGINENENQTEKKFGPIFLILFKETNAVVLIWFSVSFALNISDMIQFPHLFPFFFITSILLC